MTSTLSPVPDPSPAVEVAGVVFPPLHEKWTRDGECRFREVRLHLGNDGSFKAAWKKHKRTWLERGFSMRSMNGAWFVQQWLRVDGETLTLTEIGQNKLNDFVNPQAEMVLEAEPIKLDLPDLPADIAAKLFEYQIEPARQLLRALQKGEAEWGYPGAWDCSDMGVGKTFQALAAALASGLEVGIICPLAVIPAWKRAFQHFGKQPPLFVMNYESLRTGNRQWVKVEPMPNGEGRRFTWTMNPRDTILIFDEAHCFPSHTKITTDRGEIPIGEIVRQQLTVSVWTYDFVVGCGMFKPVTGWFRNPQKPLFRIHHENGFFDCTGEHEIFTSNRGWQAAASLCSTDYLFALRNNSPTNGSQAKVLLPVMRCQGEGGIIKKAGCLLRSLPDCLSSKIQRAGNMLAEMLGHQEIVSSRMACSKGQDFAYQSAATENFHSTQGISGAHEKQQPYGKSRHKGKDAPVPFWQNFLGSWGQRKDNCSATKSVGRSRVANGAFHRHTSQHQGAVSESTEMLSRRYCLSPSEVGSRNRRENAPSKEVEVLRPPQGGDTCPSRVVSVEILESGSGLESEWRGGDSALYDIEVEGTHCYFAEGVLVHNCMKSTGKKTQALGIAAIRQKFPLIFCSGTLARDPTEMRASGRLVGLHQGGKDFERFMQDHSCDGSGIAWKFYGGRRGREALARIHRTVFPSRGARVRIADLGDRFPDTQIVAESYDTGETQKIAAAFKEAEELLERMAKQGASEHEIRMRKASAYMEAWHMSERLKVPAIIEMARLEMEEGRSVAIFCNFVDCRQMLMDGLNTKCAIYGGQNPQHREACIAEFQADKSRVIVANIDAGGVGVSLHDVNGEFPRTSIILPTNKVVSMTQALGRVHRAGGKSRSRQVIFFAAGTVEEQICEVTRKRMAQITTLNDGELYPESRF